METPITFPNKNMILRGILHSPETAKTDKNIGVVFLNGWSGCRLGPHRMFVKTARTLTANGYHCLRFDFAGRGESDGNTQDASIPNMTSDAICAANYIKSNTPIKQIILIGICSGCKVAIGTASSTPDIDGLILWSAETMGRLKDNSIYARKSIGALRLYLKKLANPTTWKKIFTLKINTNMVNKAIFSHETTNANELPSENKILDNFQSFAKPILFLYGKNDPDTKSSAKNYSEFCKKAGIKHTFHEIDDANHSFYSLKWEREVIDITKHWITTLP